MIHSQAIVDPGARLAADVVVGPWTLIGPDVEIGPG
jgi:UDP-N-acetylglucosamine acyltransferase